MNDKIRAYGDTPAFPSEIGSLTAGISKREYFAGLAMQSLCQFSNLESISRGKVARNAVAYSDALLEELARL